MKGYSLNRDGVAEVMFEQDESGDWRNSEPISDMEMLVIEDAEPLRSGQSFTFTHTYTVCDGSA